MTPEQGVYASGHSPSVLSTHKWRTAKNSVFYLIPSLKATMKVLDVGCGPGTITVDLAGLVPQGHVTGIEYTAEPIEPARALATQRGVTNIDFQVADIHELPLEDNTFDVVHAHQVLQHIRDPIQGLKEMRRVAKKGGTVAVRESASMTWYPQSPGMTEWKDLHMAVSKAKGGHADPGSWIHVWAKRAGFAPKDIRCSAGTWCYSTKEEIEWWSGVFADHVVSSDFARFAIEGGHCNRENLERLS